MKFGFFMMPSHSHNENPTLAFERDLELIEYSEALGFDEFWVGEHHTGGWGDYSVARHLPGSSSHPHKADPPGDGGR